MTDREPPATEDLPPLHLVQMLLCDACIDGEGDECHSPGCTLWMHTVPSPGIRDDPRVSVDAGGLTDQPAAAGAARDRAVEALAAVRDALGWGDSAWVEWLVSRRLPVPEDLARTVTMIGQHPDLAGDVRRLVADRERLKEDFKRAEDEAAKFQGIAVEALTVIAVLADGNPAARWQANELRRRAGLRGTS
jgi:hypothetical protein